MYVDRLPSTLLPKTAETALHGNSAAGHSESLVFDSRFFCCLVRHPMGLSCARVLRLLVFSQSHLVLGYLSFDHHPISSLVLSLRHRLPSFTCCNLFWSSLLSNLICSTSLGHRRHAFTSFAFPSRVPTLYLGHHTAPCCLNSYSFPFPLRSCSICSSRAFSRSSCHVTSYVLT